jgi:hypothetical protein
MMLPSLWRIDTNWQDPVILLLDKLSPSQIGVVFFHLGSVGM